MSDYDPAKQGARCGICPIALAGHKNPVPPSTVAKDKLRLVIVGEAPGRKEVVFGRPFVGPSGMLVDQMFYDAGERKMRSFSLLTNASSCRSELDKDNEIAAICCAPRLYAELADIPTNVPILAFGKAAAKSVLNIKSIILSRGFVWTAKEIEESAITALEKKAVKTGDPTDDLKAACLAGRAKLAGRIVFPSVHPAFVLRSDTWKPILQIDVARCVRWLRGELTVKDIPITGPYVVTHDVKDTRRELAKLKTTVAIDIETDGIDPFVAGILCVGISDGEHTVVIDWKKDKHARVLNTFLKKWKHVVFHNGFGFDQIAMKRDGVVFDESALEDTLQAHHTFASHLPQKLDQVVSEFMPASMPWKIKFGRRGAEEKGIAPHSMHKDELWMYCLPNYARVILADGTIRKIEGIVANKEPVEVLSMGPDGTIQPKKVIGWHRQTVVGQKWTKIVTSNQSPHDQGLITTPDHKIWTSRGWVIAEKVKVGDQIALSERAFSTLERSAVLGTLLGDSCVAFSPAYRKNRKSSPLAAIDGGHKESSGLSQAKVQALRGIISVTKATTQIGFGKSVTMLPFTSAMSHQVKELYPLLYDVDTGKRRIRREVLEELGAIGLAWWFMDDGCRQNGHTKNGRKGPDTITLAIQRYRKDDAEMMQAWLTEKFGGRVGLYKDGVLRFSLPATNAFCKYVAPYIFPVCRYKMPHDQTWPEYRDEPLSTENKPATTSVVWSGDFEPPKETKGQRCTANGRFCLTVEDNHNFFTTYGLVKNCSGDVWRTAIIWHNMRFDLDRQRHVYEHDKKIALICQEMQINGIRMDVPHRDYLARKMRNRAAAFKGRMRKLVKKQTFSPSKPNDIRWALFTKFKAPILTTIKGSVTMTGLPSTASGVLEAFSLQPTRAGRLATMILHYRGVMKIKATYLDAITLGGDDRARPSWKPWGTVTGRWASRMQSTPRAKIDKITKKKLLEGRVREAYIPADGFEFHYFDVGQAEMRFAAYLSNDPKFIAEMCTSDPYLARAKALFPMAGKDLEELDAKGKPKSDLGKEFRQIAKTASLARNYLAEAEQVFAKMRADGFNVHLSSVQAAFSLIDATYREYFRYVDRNVEYCKKRGFMPSPLLGRFCWLGFFPKATDVANRPVTMGIADIMNIRLIEIMERARKVLPRDDVRLVLQIHDACVFEVRVGKAGDEMKKLIKDVWAQPVVLPVSVVCPVEQRFVLPIDLKVAMRWSDL